MAGPHDKIIANAAKLALGPLGLRRKGRSRVWLADHRWWLTVVEFQPSAWGKGSYLNVAAHWLWSELGVLSFDLGDRVAGFDEYISDEQFVDAITNMADRAAQEAQRLEETFTSVSVTADVLLGEDQKMREQGRVSWMSYHAGVAAGLVGRQDKAAEMFGRIIKSPPPPGSKLHAAAERMAQLLSDPPVFRGEVVSCIDRQRSALKLAVLDSTPI